MARSHVLARSRDSACAMARSVAVLSDPWTFLLLREAHLGRRTFAEFRDELGIATDVLSARLASLVDHGLLLRIPYREPGQRTRDAYALAPAGEEAKTVLLALQEWGSKNLPSEKPSKVRAQTRDARRHVRIAFLDDDGEAVDPSDVQFVRLEGDARARGSSRSPRS